MSFKKIDKEFCITDNSVNCYGYRLLTEGFLLNNFNPPVGYFMHDRDSGVAVRWSDFRIDGDKVYAKPTINDLAFPELATQIENGFYQAASVGHIIALEWSDDPSMKIDGQTGITVTKWFCRECSIVDIPGNYNAISELYDKDNNSLKNLISKNINPLSSSEEDVPEKYQKTFVELFKSGDLDYVRKAYPKYYEKVVNACKKQISDKIEPNQKAKLFPNGLSAIEGEVPEKYQLLSYKDLYLSGGLESLMKTHPTYVDKLKQEARDMVEKNHTRGTVDSVDHKQEKIASPSDLSIPERYRGKTLNELYLNGGLEFIKKNVPHVYKDLVGV
ncbi:MAG: hypothetical protein QM654_14025 [Dysgonamonadaceae bacterium]